MLQPHRERPKLLIVEQDEATVIGMLEALARECCAPSLFHRTNCGPGLFSGCCDCSSPAPNCCFVINSLRDLHETELHRFDLVLCAMSLPDGSGLDALAYVRGIRPELPLILTGEAAEAAEGVEAIRAGALDFLVITGDKLDLLPLALEKSLTHHLIKQENEQLHRDLSRSLTELADKNQQLRAVIEQLQMMARTDELTGLCNRRWLNETLDRMWAEAIRHDRPLAFMMIDLDGLKKMNDRLGHQQGDTKLRLAARVIAANCRTTDVAARYGGDEFCVLMPQTEAHDALTVADRIRREFDHAGRSAPDGEPQLGMSIGVAHINLSRPASAEQLISHADEALYAAKAAGRRRVMLRSREGVCSPAEFKR